LDLLEYNFVHPFAVVNSESGLTGWDTLWKDGAKGSVSTIDIAMCHAKMF